MSAFGVQGRGKNADVYKIIPSFIIIIFGEIFLIARLLIIESRLYVKGTMLGALCIWFTQP